VGDDRALAGGPALAWLQTGPADLRPSIEDRSGDHRGDRAIAALAGIAAERATDAPRLPKPDYVKPEEAAEILKEFGLKRTG
jgi:hypothetical protein